MTIQEIKDIITFARDIGVHKFKYSEEDGVEVEFYNKSYLDFEGENVKPAQEMTDEELLYYSADKG